MAHMVDGPAFKLGKELAEKMGNAVNGFDEASLIAGFCEGMEDQHRTLQQGTMRLVVGWMRHLASLPENCHDARNEASIKLARRVMTGDWCKETFQGRACDTFLPLI